MTKAQRKEHKQGNAKRREEILYRAKNDDPALRYIPAHYNVGQKGKYATS